MDSSRCKSSPLGPGNSTSKTKQAGGCSFARIMNLCGSEHFYIKSFGLMQTFYRVAHTNIIIDYALSPTSRVFFLFNPVRVWNKRWTCYAWPVLI